MPNTLLTKVLRHNKSILLACAVAISLILLAIAGLIFWQGLRDAQDDRIAEFIEQRERLELVSSQISSRLMQFVDLYEGIWTFHERDPVPVEKYRSDLVDHHGALLSGDDLTAVPFAIVSDLTRPDDVSRLALFLRIARSLSAAPSIDAHHGIQNRLTGILYAPDGSFLAISPALSDAELRVIRQQSVRKVVRAMTSDIDSPAPDAGRCDASVRPRWVSSRDGRDDTATIVIPMQKDGKCVATLAVSIPSTQFVRYFRNMESREGFYVFSEMGDPLHYGGRISGDQRVKELMTQERSRLAFMGAKMEVFRRNGAMVIAQRVAGPGWIVLYAVPFRVLISNVGGTYWITAALLFLVLVFLWCTLFFYRHRVLMPLETEASRVTELERFRAAILNTLPVGIAVFSQKKSSVLYVNRIASDLLGSTEVAEHVRFCNCVLASRDGVASDAMVEVHWSRSGGGAIVLAATLGHARLSGEEVFLMGFVDLSDKIARQALLESAKQAAEEASRAKSLFVAVISHEIRTPLHGAMGNLELLASEELKPEQNHRIDVIRRSFEGLLTLVNDILDATKIEAGALTLSPRSVNVNDVVSRCMQNFAATILAKGLTLAWSPDEKLDRPLLLDDHRLEQIIQNLLSNALKFTKFGGISVRTQCNLGSIVIEVRDTGIGISNEILRGLFEPMTQADASTSRRFGGTGLGLYLCRTLAELMGGEVNVHSVVGEGTQFTVRIPHVPLGEERSDSVDLTGVHIFIEHTDVAGRDCLIDRLQALGAHVCRNNQSSHEVAIALFDRPYSHDMNTGEHPSSSRLLLTPDGPVSAQYIAASTWHLTSLDMRGLVSHLGAVHGKTTSANVISRTPKVPDENTASILLVDDDEVSRILLRDQLMHLGFGDVRTAASGADALGFHAERRADVIFADLNMPGMDGLELVRNLRREGDEVEVIVVSASGDGDMVEIVGEFSDVLHKPVSLAALKKIVSARFPGANSEISENEADESWFALVSPAAELRMREAFSLAWKSDREALLNAANVGDDMSFRCLLHRTAGALAALGERGLADSADNLGGHLPSLRKFEVCEEVRDFINSVDEMVLTCPHQ